ncbi:hypothetical protein DITRI_Ditri06bG0144700 [Diplodiscus trichospermus]
MQNDSDGDSDGQKRIGKRVSKGTLWEAFNAYGRLKDVYIHYSTKGDRGKETTFVFVRYKFKSEMLKAIEVGNNRRIDG